MWSEKSRTNWNVLLWWSRKCKYKELFWNFYFYSIWHFDIKKRFYCESFFIFFTSSVVFYLIFNILEVFYFLYTPHHLTSDYWFLKRDTDISFLEGPHSEINYYEIVSYEWIKRCLPDTGRSVIIQIISSLIGASILMFCCISITIDSFIYSFISIVHSFFIHPFFLFSINTWFLLLA